MDEKLSNLYLETIEKWESFKSIKDFSSWGGECPFCDEADEECRDCRINHELCLEASEDLDSKTIYASIYRAKKEQNEGDFKQHLEKGLKLLKEEYKKALKKESDLNDG